MNFFSDESEWTYLFKNAIDWDTILSVYGVQFPTADGFNNKDELIGFYSELLSQSGKWAGESLWPRSAELDRVGCGTLVKGRIEMSEPLRKSAQEAREMDVYGMLIDPRYEGMGVPTSVGLVACVQLARACVATSVHVGFHTVMADMVERFCDEDIRDRIIPMIRRGEISGSMCLTEPNAGSDVGALRTSAVPQGDGTYVLNGTKCFITNASGGMHFILARTPGAPAGLDGISMFFAEQVLKDEQGGERLNFQVAKIEEKMGMHGSATCEVVYENTVARLVGKENEGFKYMLYLMNEARISVGLQGLGGIEASLKLARDYAEERKQFGKRLIDLPLHKRNIEDWETERDAFRALMVDTISHYDVYQRLDLKKRHTGDLTAEDSKIHDKAAKICRERTPLVKYYGSEANALLSMRAIQAFGGYGYMTEYQVERLHRDSIGALLYEGTSEIQSLMAMKDFVKGMMKNPKGFVQALVASHPIGGLMSGKTQVERDLGVTVYEFRKSVAGLIVRVFKPDQNLSELGFGEALGWIRQVFKKEYWEEAGRFDGLMVHAETLCQALTYLTTLRILAKHAAKDPSRAGLFNRYRKLVTPRLASVYADWRQ